MIKITDIEEGLLLAELRSKEVAAINGGAKPVDIEVEEVAYGAGAGAVVGTYVGGPVGGVVGSVVGAVVGIFSGIF